LISGTLLLVARFTEGVRGLDHLKWLTIQERQLLDEIGQQIRLMEQEVDALGAQRAEVQGLVAVWERRLGDLARKRNVLLRLAGRELPQPADRLWVAAYLDGPQPSFGAAWAEDENHARTKLVAGLGADFGPPKAVVPVGTFKSSVFA
jgi:hypothetical protein